MNPLPSVSSLLIQKNANTDAERNIAAYLFSILVRGHSHIPPFNALKYRFMHNLYPSAPIIYNNSFYLVAMLQHKAQNHYI